MLDSLTPLLPTPGHPPHGSRGAPLPMPSVPCPNPLTWPKIPLVQTSSSPPAVSPVSLLQTCEVGFSILAPIYLLGTCAWAVFKVSNRSFFTSLPPFLSLLFFLSTAGPCSSLRVLLDVPSLEELSWAPVTMSGCQSPLQGSENPLCVSRHSSVALSSLGLFTSLCLSLLVKSR